ncbi:Hsp20/alpha crystallin family protein [Massilia agilis]|uniref:Hsp20/alpha crystallin family protein n=1 Tax=Massilia agilis TaxID=1811226 RepID=A0ABT2D5Y3_9BURK|nr:Hsp20/alpha crystallin family protein [Massilia agilis]MCS0806725.1 Hsp20/alpha crystallin family protein [Massilia agilis]
MATNLTRFDPIGELRRMTPLRAFEDIFSDLAPRGGARDLQEIPMIGLDVSENDQAYTVRAEIPGVKKEDIKVEVQGNRVSISAETRREDQQKQGERVVRSELYYGQQQRTFTLDQDVDDAKASARYVDGVLELSLPKKAPGGASKVQVS